MQTKKLQVIDGETLMDARLEPTRFVVEQLLPQGLALLGGAPKIGKSWLTLDLCVRVAKGEPLWNFLTWQGTVLYLCLEDKWQRIQDRLNDITDEVPSTIFFAVSAGTIADGLAAQIDAFVKEHPGMVLVAIDTFQVIRQNSDTKTMQNSSHRPSKAYSPECSAAQRIAYPDYSSSWPLNSP